MALPVTLNTNEVKNSAGTEVEFETMENSGRSHTYKQVNELPGVPHRLKISHLESGQLTSKRRRSVIRIDRTEQGGIDNTKAVTNSVYVVADIAVGNLATFAAPKDLLAELMSFLATTGAATTVLFDCTGNGANALINGSL